MRWKAHFFNKGEEDDEIDDDKPINDGNFGFKSTKCPPQTPEMIPFEEDMLKMVENIKFRKVRDNFQSVLKRDIQNIRKSDKMLIPADKTRNFYNLQQDQYNKLLRENIRNRTN